MNSLQNLNCLTRICNPRLSLALPLMLMAGNAISQPADQRQVIELNDAQRAHVLGEMRSMLSGTNAILASLASKDMSEVAHQARLLGMNMGHKAENTVHDALPPTFMQMGMSVHKAFDAIANHAENGATTEQTLTELNATMNTCVGCHQIYQIRRVNAE